MRRPFLLNGSRVPERGTGEPIFDSVDLRLQRLNFPMLPEHHIAQLCHRLLEVGDFGLNPLERVFKLRQRFAP
jgi:hypothetical protein